MSDQSSEEKDEPVVTRTQVIVALIGLVVIFAAYGFGVRYFAGGFSKAGPFGDTFGALNSLFASIAALGVVVAIFLQQQQLKIQRKELKAQQEELRLTREEMKEGRKELAKQSMLKELSILQSHMEIQLQILDQYSKALQLRGEAANRANKEKYADQITENADKMRKIHAHFDERLLNSGVGAVQPPD